MCVLGVFLVYYMFGVFKSIENVQKLESVVYGRCWCVFVLFVGYFQKYSKRSKVGDGSCGCFWYVFAVFLCCLLGIFKSIQNFEMFWNVFLCVFDVLFWCFGVVSLIFSKVFQMFKSWRVGCVGIL